MALLQICKLNVFTDGFHEKRSHWTARGFREVLAEANPPFFCRIILSEMHYAIVTNDIDEASMDLDHSQQATATMHSDTISFRPQ